MTNVEKLYEFLPNQDIDWKKIDEKLLYKYVVDMKQTPQEFKWHQEGNVYVHTKMILSELINLDEYKQLDKLSQLILFLSALFHDVGKPSCTKIIDGEIRSFRHGMVGSKMIRNLLIKDFGISGTKDYLLFRECICMLIKYHSRPVYITGCDGSDAKKIIKLSVNSQLNPLFNLKLLYILSKADVLGRISADKEEQLEKLEMFKSLAIKLDCYNKSFSFDSGYTKYNYFIKNNIWENQSLYDSSECEVIMLCGLPLSGKDTYIQKHYSTLDVVSLDCIRDKLNISPEKDQSLVMQESLRMIRSLLGNKQSFVYNATNLKQEHREKLICLFHSYNAKVKIVYIETLWDNLPKRNKIRDRKVPMTVINNMLEYFSIPENFEAETVEWITSE